MPLRDGRYRMGPPSGHLLVKTGRSGLGSRAGHDLTLEAVDWNAQVTVATADPGRSSVMLEAMVNSLEARSGSGGIKPLTDSDRADIRGNIRSKILHSDRYPTITFTSTGISGSAESLEIAGELTVMDRTGPLVATATVTPDGHVTGSATVVQTRWGITPYSAFFGALKLADEVRVELDGPLEPA